MHFIYEAMNVNFMFRIPTNIHILSAKQANFSVIQRNTKNKHSNDVLVFIRAGSDYITQCISSSTFTGF